jgi:hypothetical protein
MILLEPMPLEITQPQQSYEIGMVGLGVMGRNLVPNISVAGYDKDLAKVEALPQYQRNVFAACISVVSPSTVIQARYLCVKFVRVSCKTCADAR